MRPLVVMENVNFTINNVSILQSLSFSMNEGEKILLLGPNGSGKSTLMKALAGVINPSGKIDIEGDSIFSLKAKRQRRYVPQQIDFPIKITVGEIFEFVQSHYEHKISQQDWLKAYQFDSKSEASTLSGGQMRKLALALSLLGNPKLLLLDEPEVGLDVCARENVLKEMILRAEKQHASILMTTHLINYAVDFFNRVLIMEQGKIIFDASIEEFLSLRNTIFRWDVYADDLDWVINNHIKDRFQYVYFGGNTVRIYTDHTASEPLNELIWPGKHLRQSEVTAEDVYLYHMLMSSRALLLS